MKHLLLFIIIIALNISSYGQIRDQIQYNNYMHEGKELTKTELYFEAYQKFRNAEYWAGNDQKSKKAAQDLMDRAVENIRHLQQIADNALAIAEKEKIQVQKALEELDYKTYSLRSEKFNLNTTIIYFCDELLKKSNREDSLMLLLYKAQSYSFIGDNDSAAKSISMALKIDSTFLEARTFRIYYYSAIDEHDLSGKDAQEVYAKNPNFMNTMYMGFKFCRQGLYKEASKYFIKAINKYQYGILTQAYLSTVHEEIEIITNQKDIYIDGLEFCKALYFQILAMKAYSGENDFEKTYNDLDSIHLSRGAYLYIYAWTANNEKVRPDDYGVYAMQGAMFEKAEFPNWAFEKYKKFKCVHIKKSEKRYEILDHWVDNRIKYLGQTYSKEQLVIKNKFSDPKFLYLNANELYQKLKYKAADSLINMALASDSLNIEYLLLKVKISERLKAYQDVIKKCNKIIDLAPNTSKAYYYRAVAARNTKGDLKMIIKDLNEAIYYEPYYVDALFYLGLLTSEINPLYSLSLLYKAKEFSPYYIYINQMIEKLEDKNNRKK